MVLVSIIIPAYNAEKFINRCLDSIFAQTFENFEVIVVADKSTDKTLDFLKSYLGKCSLKSDKRLQLIFNERKSSPAIARNIGINASNGNFIAFCDIDDEWLPDKLNNQVTFMINNPDIDLCYTGILQILKNGEFYIPSREWTKKSLLWNNYIFASTIFVRKEAINQLKKNYGQVFDENIKNCDDYDFLLMLNKFIKMGRSTPEVMARIYIHGENMTFNSDFFKRLETIAPIAKKHGYWIYIKEIIITPFNFLVNLKKKIFPQPWLK